MSDTHETARRLPLYRQLPLDASRPLHSAWGVFGNDDEVGTINLLSRERLRRAAGLVRKGALFSLNWSLENPSPPLFTRGALKHTITAVVDGTDDRYDNFYPQASSQWDALSHSRHPQFGFYNGRTMDDITGRPGSRNGIDHWARRGIAGRFVLADVDRYRQARGAPIRHGERDVVTVDDIDSALAHQGVSLEEGDILLLRFGWVGWYERADRATREQLAAVPYIAAPGLSSEERTAEWLWDKHVAAVLADCPALEAIPGDVTTADGWLHYRLIALLGLAIGEMIVLDPLAADCAADGVYEGLFTAAPLHKVGGSGSPANALALK